MVKVREILYQKLTNGGFIDCFLYMVSTYPENIAIEIPEDELKLTYRELLLKTEQMKAILEKLKINKGDTVCLLVDSILDFTVSFFALTSIEAVTMPVSITLTSYELEKIYNLGKPLYIVTTIEIFRRYRATIEKFSNLKCIIFMDGEILGKNDRKIQYEWFYNYLGKSSGLSSPKSDSVITLNYTYKGVGRPLGVCHTYKDYNFNIHGILNSIIYEPGSTVLSFLPVYQIYGILMVVIFPIISGFKIVNIRKIQKYNLIDLFEQFDIKIAYFIPPFFKKLIKDAELSKNKGSNFLVNPAMKIISSGSYLNEDLIRQIYEVLNIEIIQGYGGTEALAISFSSGYNTQLKTLGLPLREDIRIKVCNSEGHALEAGHIGEIVIQSPCAASEFKGDVDATSIFFKNNCFYSGDIGWIDYDGFLHFIGRSCKIAKNNSQMVDLSEVSSIIRLLEDVEEVYTTTESSLLVKQKIISFIALKKESPISTKEIRMHCQEYLSKHKVPTEIYLYKQS